MDLNIKLKNGQVLKGMIKSAGDETRGVIVLVHGLGEHMQRYNEWAGLFSKEKIAFTGMDLPGHGRSEGKRGHIRPYSMTAEMIDILLNTAMKTFPGVPVYLYGHSMGGAIVLDYLLRRSPRITGGIVTSPLLRLGFRPSKSKLALASVMKVILPGLVQPAGLVLSHLSHDPAVVDSYMNDPLVHGKISVSLFNDLMKSSEFCLKNAASLKVPTLLLHGTDDLICSPEGSREFASKTPMVHLKMFDGGYHELQNETFKSDVFRYIINWIGKKTNGVQDESKYKTSSIQDRLQ